MLRILPSPPGLTGWPSIPARLRSIIDAPAYWVARSSRAMTGFFGDAPHTPVTTRLDRVAQYPSASAFDHRCPGVLGRPIKSGDDGFFGGCSACAPSEAVWRALDGGHRPKRACPRYNASLISSL